MGTREAPGLGRAAAALVAEARVSHVATVDAAGMPHVVPICHVLDGDRLVFAPDTDTRKVRNLAADPRATVCVDAYDEDWSELRQVIVSGEATLHDGGPAWERGRDLLYAKFPQYPSEAPIDAGTTTIVELRITRVLTSGL